MAMNPARWNSGQRIAASASLMILAVLTKVASVNGDFTSNAREVVFAVLLFALLTNAVLLAVATASLFWRK
jgi:hypothetical protein